MSADEFWKDDPQLFVSYRTAFINQKQREVEEHDYKCWLQGLYIHDGNGKLFSSLKQLITNIVASFVKGQKDNTVIDSYPKKPYTELEKDHKRKEIAKKQQDKYENYEKSLVYFGTMKQRYLEKLQKKGEGGK